jgi:cytochrome c peroxidase
MLRKKLFRATHGSAPSFPTNPLVRTFLLFTNPIKLRISVGWIERIGKIRATLTILACAAILGSITGCNSGSASAQSPNPPSPDYNPYPPGILPSDLDNEIARVSGEIHTIFNEALTQASKLPPLTLTGNPPTFQGTGYTAQQVLGKLLNYDSDMSPSRSGSCASCHMPYAGFGGPIPSVNLTMSAYNGSFHYRAGKRTPLRYSYSPEWPVLEFNPGFARFIGGNFWDARSTGYSLQSADAEQAQHPPVDSQEMGFPDTACIAFRISQAPYRHLFEEIWRNTFDIEWPSNTDDICGTFAGAAEFGDDTTPVKLSPGDRAQTNTIYDHWAQSISFFEHSSSVSPFTSKFDAFLANGSGGSKKYEMTADEKAGYDLFNGKAGCNGCHNDGLSTQKGSNVDAGSPNLLRPLFTGFFYVNYGVPLNPAVPFYYQTTPDPSGFTPNPYGFAYRDLGVGTFLRSGFGSGPNPNADWISRAPANDGKMATSSLRNIAMAPPQCPTTEAPGPYFQKAFFHNGYAKSLKQVVHFENTRDVYAYPVTSGHCPAGTVEKVTCWPMPEVANNLSMGIGNLGLTDKEEDQIVAFMLLLTDGYMEPFPDINTFTGTCKAGGSASTQGNEAIIPTPPLPACASAICDVAPLPSPPIE